MTQKMTIAEATVFSHKSLASELILEAASRERGCSCKAYTSYFTFRRWKAQGFQVQKGEHGIKLTTYIPVHKTDPKTGEKVPNGVRPKTTSVFCSCQVKPIVKKEKH